MIILSHRGYWKSAAEKNTPAAFHRSFDLGFGTETDVRDRAGELVISHDMPNGSEITLAAMLDILDGRDLPLAMNIKADGLARPLNEQMNARGLTRWFTFDMSVPEMVVQLRLGLPVFSRASEYEEPPARYADAVGVWLDAFTSQWYDVSKISGTTFDGLPTRRKLQILADKHLPTELHGFINDMKQRYTMEIVNANCKPRFNHQYALSMLKAKGYRIAVASNSIRHTIEVMMRYAELDAYLDFIISNEDVTKAKPDPEMYSLAISKLRVAPEECLIVEDNENGIKAARASGAHVLEVDEVDDVTWTSISQKIMEIDAAVAAA